MKRTVSMSVVILLLATACSDDTQGTSTSVAPTSTTSATSTSVAPTTAPPTTTPTTTTAAPTTTTSAPTTTIPGEPIDFGPAAGDQLAVIGVEFDDVLNLRAGPHFTQPILGTLAPTYDNMIAEGEAWSYPGAIWYKVDAEGTVGWVNSSFVAYLGAVDDITSRVVDLIGEIPTAPTMLELADIVADVLKSTEEPVSEVTVTVAPTTGDLGEIVIDIVGFGDDALRGLRAHIFGQPDNGGFSLKSVEATALCGRGVADGPCV